MLLSKIKIEIENLYFPRFRLNCHAKFWCFLNKNKRVDNTTEHVAHSVYIASLIYTQCLLYFALG